MASEKVRHIATRNRFRFVFLACDYLYYDSARAQYMCALVESGYSSTRKCRQCKKLKAITSEEPIVDLRNIK